jgi:deoxyribose-phosphate aldolase
MKEIKNKGQDKTMNETTRRFARLVDLSAVQATSTEADVRACAELAARYNIISVHVLPCWTRFLSTLLPQQGTGEVMIGGPVGFPGGGHTTDTKVQEVRQLIADGAREVDMVVNIGKVLSGAVSGLRGQLWSTQYDLFISTPLSKPDKFHSDALNMGFSLQWRY